MIPAPSPDPGQATAAGAECVHCGARISGSGRFCCSGCAAAYELVNRLGLARYYDSRAAAVVPPRTDPETAPQDLTPYIRQEADGSLSLAAVVEGVRCAACLWLIESALAAQDDVISGRLAVSTGRLSLKWRGSRERGGALLALVCRLGYRVQPCDPARFAMAGDGEERRLLRAMAVAGFAAANIMLLSVAVWSGSAGGEMGNATRDLLHWVSALIALPAVAYAGQPFFASAFAALRAGRSNMDVPISVGIVLATGMSVLATLHSDVHAYFDSAATLLFLLLIGRYLERRARGRARSAAATLLAIDVAPVTRVTEAGMTARVMPASLAIGDEILVAAGERIGADGAIVSGSSTVDRSLIDGETMPAPVSAGTAVNAGMTNIAAPLRIRVTATGTGTYLGEIVRLMEAAEHGRSGYTVLADRVARFYAPAGHLLALITFVSWLALGRGWQASLASAVAVLIITCPCALGLAVPAVQVIAAGRLMRRGILLKTATALERLAAVDTVAFDKTGTLTLGHPTLIGPVDNDALELASALAAASRHPLSRALRARRPDVPVAEGVAEHPGEGLSWNGPYGEVRLGSRHFCAVPGEEHDDHLELWLTRPDAAPLRFHFADELRPDAGAVVRTLRRAGKRVLMLSGDRSAAVQHVADNIGIAEWSARLTPVDKTRRLALQAAAGRRVLMVGDGLNDAPALAAASVSMSPSSGSDISQNAADIVFRGDSLTPVTETLAVARHSRMLVHENLIFAVAYNAVAVPLAMAGCVTPLIAAVAMSSSSLIVILNALRLRLLPIEARL
ncbi:MAG: cadmium-translocating P-type ATPase [Alphaproteobacteria bacterium]|nr:cadmium-translocating P-type ATPase [Alphaproteobacteria bacterium]